MLRFFRLAVFCAVLHSLVCLAQTTEHRPVTIGVLDTIDPWFYVQMFAPTMEHLRETLPQLTFQTIELSPEKLEQQAKANQLDFFIAPSGFYSHLADSSGANHIATRHSYLAEDPARSVGSVFVVRSDDTRYRTLSDLRHATVAATSPESFSGWTIALGEIKKIDEDVDNFFGNVIFSGYGLPDVVSLVQSREADVGILSVCTLERYRETDSVRENSLRIINEKPESGLACRRSTDLYPDVVFAALPKAPSWLVKDVTVALLTMPQSMNGDMWGFASNFGHVNQLYKELKIGPYAYLRETTLPDFLHRYRYALVAVLTCFALILVYVVLVRRIVRIRTKALRLALQETKLAQEKSQKTQDRLYRLEKAGVIGGLSAMFAHDVRQPIASLMNYAGGLRMYLQNKSQDPLVLEAITEIETQANRISGIVDRVRSYAKNEDHLRTVIDLDRVIDKALETFSRSRLSHDIEIHRKTECPTLCLADPLELELVFVNLLRNAATAIENQPDKHIDIRLINTANNMCSVQIIDNGPPLPPDQLALLGTPIKSEKTTGLGLGLTVCRVIVESHGGHLTFESVQPHGLKVCVVLPKASQESKK